MSEENFERLDKRLVELGLVETRSRAQQLIQDGKVLVNSKVITKTSYKVLNDEVTLTEDSDEVGRGFHKIAGAFDSFAIDVKNKVVADVGASTGGFTQFCLGLGANKVFAIDVGHGQLAKSLREDQRVINLEGTNIREVDSLDEPVELVVVDLSFISLNLIWQNLYSICKEGADLIVLFKPQFEVGRSGIGKKGIVKGPEYVATALTSAKVQCEGIGFKILGFEPCVIKGRKSGNQEYFMYLKKDSDKASMGLDELLKVIGE